MCLGRRRLEIFGRNQTSRVGWVTVGLNVVAESTFDALEYEDYLKATALDKVSAKVNQLQEIRVEFNMSSNYYLG